MHYPLAIIEKAKRTEELVKRVSAGEALVTVCDELNISVSSSRFAKLLKRYEAGGQSYESLIDGRQGHAQKSHAGIQEYLYGLKRDRPQLKASQLAAAIESKFDVKFSEGHINYLLRRVGLSSPQGRPKSVRTDKPPETDLTDPADEELPNAGLFFPRSGAGRDGSASRCRTMHRFGDR